MLSEKELDHAALLDLVREPRREIGLLREENVALLGEDELFTFVLESLRPQVAEFTLQSVQSEVPSWLRTGESRFTRLQHSSGLAPPRTSRLNTLVPD